MSELSKHDARVLAALFDPEAGVGAEHSSSTTDDKQKSATVITTTGDAETLSRQVQQEEWTAIAPLQTESVSGEVIKQAEQKLSDIIARHPGHASAYVNRAQTRRMRAGVDAADTGVFDDLGQAIKLASSQPATICRRTLAAAHTHRGFMLAEAAAKRDGEVDGHMTPLVGLPGTLRDASADALNELAYHDFAQGAKHGDELARAMATRTNPYAKMCGAIVKEALREEIDTWTRLSGASLNVLPAKATT